MRSCIRIVTLAFLTVAVVGCSSMPLRLPKGSRVFVEKVVCAATIDSDEHRSFATLVDEQIRDFVTAMDDVELVPPTERNSADYVVQVYLTHVKHVVDEPRDPNDEHRFNARMWRIQMRGVLVRIPRAESEQVVAAAIPSGNWPSLESATPLEWDPAPRRWEEAARDFAVAVALGSGIVRVNTLLDRQHEYFRKEPPAAPADATPD